MQRRGESGQPVKGQRHRTIRPKTRKAPIARLPDADLQEQLNQRTRERDEALEQQAAITEVLKVISGSPGHLESVFEAMLKNATRICGAKFGVMTLYEGGDAFRVVALHNAPAPFVELRRREPVMTSAPLRQLVETKKVIHLPDLQHPTITKIDPASAKFSAIAGVRTIVVAPMLNKGELIGTIGIYRQEVAAFSEKQIELLQNFAAQAVVAIENTRLLSELRKRTDDLSESLEQQTATSEVLKVISSSPGDLKPVFEAILANATRICDAKFGILLLSEGDAFRIAALHGAPRAFAEARRPGTIIRPAPGHGLHRAASTRQPVQLADIRAEPAYTNSPQRPAVLDLAGARTLLAVPMVKEDKLVGLIDIYRQEVRPFTDKQIDLVKNFAAQAVIAIENSRLLNELRESLQQQTATADVLTVISSSPGELTPVFESMLENAVRICEASFGNLLLYENDAFRDVALHNAPEAWAAKMQRDPVAPRYSARFLYHVAETKQVSQITDITTENPDEPIAKFAGARTLLIVPMLKGSTLVGAIAIYRQEVRLFTDKQIELVKNFAAQAVIAIENTRLLNELRQRTDDLSESLEQQTATSEVLRVISSSPGELEPVFQALLGNATRLCTADFGFMFQYKDGFFELMAQRGADRAYVEYMQGEPLRPGPETLLGRIAKSISPVQIADFASSQAYLDRDPLAVVAVERGGVRTLFGVPMLREGELIGAVALYRQEVSPFTEKQIDLLTNFAAQAVIAIENARLLSELRESLQQQTATADVLKVISSSPGDLEPVFQAMLQKATQICEAKFGVMFRFADGAFRAVSWLGNPPAYTIEQPHIVSEHPHNPLTRIVTTKKPVHISDLTKERAYIEGNPRIVALVDTAGARSLLVVPMVKNEELIGAIAIYWQEARSFTEKQIELISNFAAQAVIAIDNIRLLSELRESLQQQTATADVLKVISRSTFDLGTVLQTLVESAARLCDADKTNITRQKDGVFFRAEAYGFSAEFMDYVRDIPIKPDRGSAFGRALLERRAVHIPDVKADAEYTLMEGQKLGDFRTVLAVPMLREDVVVGVLTLTRSNVRPFTEKQIELASTFADQAAIAIENVRLFESVEARTRELAASLEDLRSTQDRLVQTQKLASLGQLTAGIAHEIKNPLNFVNNFSAVSSELVDELQETLKGPLEEKVRAEVSELAKTLRGNLDKVVQHGKRADAIVKNMLLHSREGSGEHRPVHINALVEEGLNLAYHGARAEKQGFNITLERSLDPAAGVADVFPQDITRVLLNLISNGFYAAMKRKAEVNGRDYEPTLAVATKNLGDRVEIKIRDNGTGIPPEVKQRLFTPFFTTKPAGEGTGLGLSISHDIVVKQHGGSIEVDTEPGEFTEIRMILPRAGALLPERLG